MRELTLSASSTESKRSNLMALCVALLLFVTGALIAVNLAQPAAYAAVASTAVTTYRNDNGRTGQYPNETVLNTSNVNVSQFGKRVSYPVDGQVYALPLYVQCHLAYLPTTALTCRFVSDRQSSRQRRPERICAGQSDKEGQGILEDQLRLSGIGSMSRISPSAAASTTSPSRPRRTTPSMRSTPTRPAPGRRSGRPALLPSGATAVPNGLTSCANAQKARFGAGQLPGVMVVLSTRTRVRFLVACGTPPTLISPGEQCDHFQVQHKDDAEHCSEDCRACPVLHQIMMPDPGLQRKSDGTSPGRVVPGPLVGLAAQAGMERRGIATQLMAAAEAWAAARGLPFLTLETGAANQPARKLYAALGYQEEYIRLTKAITTREDHPATIQGGQHQSAT